MDVKAARGLRVVTWAVVLWTTAQALGAIVRHHYLELIENADSVEAMRQARDTLMRIEDGRGLTEAACTAAALVGLLALWRTTTRSRGALGLALAAAVGLAMWWATMIAWKVVEADVSLDTVRWMFRGRLVGVIALWTGIAFAIPRLRPGAVDLRRAGVIAALAVWCFGVPLWADLTEMPSIALEHRGLWSLLVSVTQVAAATLLFVEARRALAGSSLPAVDWSAPGAGLELAANGLVAQVVILAVSVVLAFTLLPFMLLGGLGAVAQVGFFLALLIAGTVTAIGMYVAARTSSAEASSMAAAALAAFLLAAMTQIQLWVPSARMPDLSLVSGACQLLGVLFVLGYIHRVATELGHGDMAARAGALNLGVLAVVGGSSLLAHALSSGRLSGAFATITLIAAAIISAVMLLAVTKAAHRLAHLMRDGATVATARARTRS